MPYLCCQTPPFRASVYCDRALCYALARVLAGCLSPHVIEMADCCKQLNMPFEVEVRHVRQRQRITHTLRVWGKAHAGKGAGRICAHANTTDYERFQSAPCVMAMTHGH